MRRPLLCAALLLALPMSGCDTQTSDRLRIVQAKVDTIEERISSLESRVDVAERRQNAAEESINKVNGKITANNLSTTDIQAALKNAGFYNGSIDGKMGPNTANAIKEFQKANGMKADGIVGAKTRDLLAKHLSEEIN